jgi:hypothetical protein
METIADIRAHLLSGLVIPAHPLAIDSSRRIDEKYQRALTRYYVASGSAGLAVGVHTTQFKIHDPNVGLFKPVLDLASESIDSALSKNPRPFVKVAGICGKTLQAMTEAHTAINCGYHAGLLSVADWRDCDEGQILSHCREVASAIPIIGFYLQPSVGGRSLSYRFWRRFLEIENVVAIKIAPFNRYQTLDVVRAAAESGRSDVALYTGNDDNIIVDLLSIYKFESAGQTVERRFAGGLLGHWAVWTSRAVELLNEIKSQRDLPCASPTWMSRNIATTDANAVIFDAANGFAGCIAGIHEVLHRHGLMRGTWCLDPNEVLSQGQSEEIDRIWRAYPSLRDSAFIDAHRDEWLR